MDYTTLLDTVASRMNRSDLTSLIPAFIVSVESEANTFLAGNPVRPMYGSTTGTVSTNEIELPADFLDIIEITLSDGTTSWPLARTMLGSRFGYYADKAIVPGLGYDSDIPQQFRIDNNDIVLSITPSSSLSYTLEYWAKPLAVSSTNSTNWLMDAHPDVYEFGTLAHAAKHVRDMSYYTINRDLFISALGAVPSAYPEHARAIGRRVTDAPFGRNRWNRSYG